MNKILYPGHLSFRNKAKRAIWNIACSIFFRPFGTGLFRRWRILILRLFGANVSFGANVYASSKIWAPWNLRMKKGACLGPHTICYNQAIVEMEENATLSQYSYLCTAGHETDKTNTASEGLITAAITIGKDAWIGTRAFIGMGVEIGEGAIIGATASVYKDVEAWTIVGGNPAKFIKKRVLK